MTLQERRDALILYLRAKLVEEDWHAISDVANDLRVLDAQMAHFTAIETMKDYTIVSDEIDETDIPSDLGP